MSHKAGADFFDQKRSWSERKDRILGNYLAAYLPKVSKLGRPILIVDGFAGPGRFKDGRPGSPVIIAETVQASAANADVLAIEQRPELFDQLRIEMKRFPFARVRCGEFRDSIPEIYERAQRSSVFLYLDPFALRGLEMDKLQSILNLVSHGHSIEILVNCNAVAFVRCARQHLAVTGWENDPDEDPIPHTSPELLDGFAGGGWWRDSLAAGGEFAESVYRFMSGYADQLQGIFSEVCVHEIKRRHAHTTPKYFLAFGSRHEHAMLLMNDEMCKSLETLAAVEAPAHGSLFEMRPESLVPDVAEIEPLILRNVLDSPTRRELITRVVRAKFGMHKQSTIRKEVERLLKNGQLVSETGKTRINDDVRVRRHT